MNTKIKMVIHATILTIGAKIFSQRLLELIFNDYVNPSCSDCVAVLVLGIVMVVALDRIEKES